MDLGKEYGQEGADPAWKFDDKKRKEASRCFKEAIQLDPRYKDSTPAQALQSKPIFGKL